MSESKRKKQHSLYIGIIVCILVAVAAILCLLFTGKETYVSEGDNIESVDALYCRASEQEDSFFGKENVINDKHEIKITQRQDEIDKISYTYIGYYGSEKEAKDANAVLHAKFNNYMGEHNLEPSVLGPVFSVVKDNLRINLMTEISNINEAIGKLFFLDPAGINSVRNNKLESLKKLYSSQGFVCKIKD